MFNTRPISSWLKSQSINVPDDWITACVEWLQSENGNTNDAVKLRKMVYEQWLMTDLADLQTAVLPEEVHHEKFVLRGEFCLQINRLIDVSQPKYSQLQEIQKKENSNNFISAETQTTQKPWEAKPTRMLMLTLSDGVVEVCGMEYQPIVKLNRNLQPGTKVRIKGPVNCRRGVLMLKQNNIEVIGGVVDDLVQENRYEAVLCRGLGRALPTGDAQNSVENELSDEVLDEIMADVDFDDEVSEENQRTIEKNEKCQNVRNKEWEEDPDDDVIIIDDLDDFLADAEEDEASRSSHNSEVAGEHILKKLRPNEKNTSLMGQEKDMSSASTSVQCIPSNNTVLQRRKLSKDKGCISENTGFISKSSGSFNNIETANANKTNLVNMKSTTTQNIEPLPLNTNKPSLHKLHNIESKTFAKINSTSKLIEDKGNVTPSTLRKPHNVDTKPFAKHTQTSKSIESKTAPNANKSAFKTEDGKSTNAFLSRCGHAPNPPTIVKYLCQAKFILQTEDESVVKAKVKALVITLLSKLKSDKSQWNLSARICDGTDMLDVEFSDKVLRALIGFTAAEAEQVKVHPSDPDQRNQLREGMERCRDTIITMCHPMYVTVTERKDCVYGIVEKIDF